MDDTAQQAAEAPAEEQEEGGFLYEETSEEETVLTVDGVPTYMAAEHFRGGARGFYFGVGHRGLGYYRDWRVRAPACEVMKAWKEAEEHWRDEDRISLSEVTDAERGKLKRA